MRNKEKIYTQMERNYQKIAANWNAKGNPMMATKYRKFANNAASAAFQASLEKKGNIPMTALMPRSKFRSKSRSRPKESTILAPCNAANKKCTIMGGRRRRTIRRR